MRKRGNVLLWTNKDSVLELRDAIYMKKRWYNSTRSFEGHPLSDSSRLQVVARIQDSDEMTLAARFQFVCDDPDYAVFSAGLPVLWHSTTTIREDEWVAPFSDDNTKYRAGLKNAIGVINVILPWLNVAECQDRPVIH